MDLSRALSRLIAAAVWAAALLSLALEAWGQCPTPSATVIGPGTPCAACWTNPLTHTDGSPLLELLTTVHVYLDPPAGGPVIGTTVPMIVAPISNGVAGATATLALCPNFALAPSSGPHTLSVSVLTASAESAGSTPPLPFDFQAVGPGNGSAVVYR